MIGFDTFTKVPKNVRDLGKLIIAKGLKKLPKVQKIAQSGHTACQPLMQPQPFKNWRRPQTHQSSDAWKVEASVLQILMRWRCLAVKEATWRLSHKDNKE